MKVTFVVAGESCELDCPPDSPVFAARYRALIQTSNTGRPPSDFVIWDTDGNILSPLALIRDLPPGLIWLSPAVGMGGSHRNHRRKAVPPIMNGSKCQDGRTGTRKDIRAHARTHAAVKRIQTRQERRQSKRATSALDLI